MAIVERVTRGLRSLGVGALLLRELRGVRKALERANELKEAELRATGLLPGTQAPAAEEPPRIRVSEVDPLLAAEMAEIEMQLHYVKGEAPDEDEVMKEYQRRHGDEDDPRRWETLEGSLP